MRSPAGAPWPRSPGSMSPGPSSSSWPANIVLDELSMESIGLHAQVACIWEATARKPGNVHRYLDFPETTYLDFLLSAAAVAPVLDQACRRRVGETILEGVRATRRVVSTNTNLGILLLLAPLA